MTYNSSRTKEEIELDVKVRKLIVDSNQKEAEFWSWRADQAKYEAEKAKIERDEAGVKFEYTKLRIESLKTKSSQSQSEKISA